MEKNNQSEINNAIFVGLLGLAIAFFTMREMIDLINIDYLKSLIIVFLFVGFVRVFATILEYKRLNELIIDFFAIIVTPFTVFVFTRIFFTQIIYMPTQVSILPFITGGYVFGYILRERFKLEFRANISRRKRKKK